MKIETFRSLKDRQWYFAIISSNGRCYAHSEGYKTRRGRDKTAAVLGHRLACPVVERKSV